MKMKDDVLLIAHSANLNGREQPLLEHLGNVARLAAQHASAFESEIFAEWLGWWHDAGKVAPDIQTYLRNVDATPPGPDHSSAGMLKAAEVFPLFANNIAGHHGGLPDPTYLKDRIKRKREDSKEQRVRDALVLAETILDGIASHFDISLLPSFLNVKGERATKRSIELWLRMLHSALVDADCLDTEAHFNPEKHEERTSTRPQIAELWPMFEAKQNLMLAKASDTPTSLNTIRAEIYRRCIKVAEMEQGVYSLTVPTGGGKTRSALGFGLLHALRHNLRRVIVVLPYTTIIEQNADVYRELLGNEAVLEHHSAASSKETPGEMSDIERRQRMATENWDAPVIVTTSVQLFESLFANRNSRVRKLHNIARSVLILDEIQTFPPHLLRPTLDVLRQLTEAYGVTILLCTATQPAFRDVEDINGVEGFDKITEILPDPGAVYEQLKRVRYHLAIDTPWSWEKIAEELCRTTQAMVIMNTVKDALRLLDELKNEDHVFHLSANLCGQHRREVLAVVRERLKNNEPVRLVATQVVEAGVDIDFPRVLRALGPLDSIIQAAGRCNREGRLDEGEVVVFKPEEGKVPPGSYKTGTQQTESMLKLANPNDLHDFTLPTRYFHRLYQISETDRGKVQLYREKFSFVETAKAYRLIDDDRVPVLVSYGSGTERERLDRIVAKIRYNASTKSRERKAISRNDWRQLQPYLVSLREQRLKEACDLGICHELVEGLYILENIYYDALRGISIDKPGISDLIIDA